ncbi:MAG: 6-carboxytetrahydropterin synthase [Methylohalobius sp.]|nr:6-carboxytetrahydropterin synthase [Methylohalobius sp.]
MYQLGLQRDFIARHYLIGGDFGAENIEHSHAYRVEVRLSGEMLNRHGYLVDLVVLEQAVEKVVARFRDRCLNELPEFAGLNPSLEHFCRILYQELKRCSELGGLALTVRLWENPHAWASYGDRC